MKGAKMKRWILTMLLLGGCAGFMQQRIQRIPFPGEEYARLSKMGTGTATVHGQVFMKTMVGEVRYGAGNEVRLAPVTTYSTQVLEVTGNWNYTNYTIPPKFVPEEPDPRLDDYAATTMADGEGRFEFRNVPPGGYYLTSSVIWYVPQQYGSIIQGGNITKKITVKEGDEVRVILTR